MNRIAHFLFLIVTTLVVSSCFQSASQGFITARGTELVNSEGKPVILRGTNLGFWLNPEGYMFGFERTSSPRMIAEAFAELVGPLEARKFWDTYLENFITRRDIAFIKSIGSNVVRVPFNYRMLTDEDYLGRNYHGFKYLDRVVEWCRQEGLWVILDMHAAPGGQTGDNIDDSYGYPYLFENEEHVQLLVDIWKSIARRYQNNTTVVGYDLLNEPIAHYHGDSLQTLNSRLEPVYKRVVSEIRSIDKNHLIFLGGAQANYNFNVFGSPFADQLVYSFHKYAWDIELVPADRIPPFEYYLQFQKRHKVPLYLGESGETGNQWVKSYRELLERHGVHWTFWPYKRMDAGTSIVTFAKPDGYETVINFVEGDRSSYHAIRANRPDRQVARRILQQFAQNALFENCRSNTEYTKALISNFPSH